MSPWLLLVVLLGLVPAGALLLPRLRPAALAVAPWAALPALLLALFAPAGLTLELPSVLLGTRLGLDATGQVFLSLTALLWLLSGIYARSYLAHDADLHRFFACFLLAMTGNLGLTVALDMASFYCGFALMSFAAYGLIVHYGDREAQRAGRIYIIMVIFGELLLFAALVVAALDTHHIAFAGVMALLPTAPHRDLVLGLALAGFGVKAGALPLHVWLPLAHPAAPTPASAVLSGAMIKAGLLGWLRFLPLGALALPGWAALMMAAGVTALFLGAAVGAVQRLPKAVLAYSSISQMGLMTLGVGVGLAAPQQWPITLAALQLYALHHALAKGALFLGVEAAATQFSRPWQRAAVLAGLVVPALALAGAPWTSGAAAKTAFKAATRAAPGPWPTWLDWLLPLGAVATTLVMARFLLLIFISTSTSTGEQPPGHLAARALAAWAALVVAVLAVVWVAPAPAFRGAIAETLSVAAFWGGLWPVLLGAAVAWRLARSGRAQRLLARLQVPAGDLVVLVERAREALRRRPSGRQEAARSRWLAPRLQLSLGRARLQASAAAAALERFLARWPVGGAMLLALIALMAWLLARSH